MDNTTKYLSGDELYRFLHISKRKMKYLLENGYITVIDTGKKTHRYLVKQDDAEAFRNRMNTEEKFLCELYGKFTSTEPKTQPPTDVPTKEQCEAFAKYLTDLWQSEPDALPTQTSARLSGIAPQRIHEQINKGNLLGVKIENVFYCPKDEFIAFVSHPKYICGVGKLREIFERINIWNLT